MIAACAAWDGLAWGALLRRIGRMQAQAPRTH